MTISSINTKTVYECDGSNREFSILFPLNNREDLRLYVTDLQNKTTEITAGYRYTAGGMICYPDKMSVPALAQGCKLTLMRRTPMRQDIDLISYGNLDVEVLEKNYDKIFMILQELNDEVKRSIKVPVCEEKAGQDAQEYLNSIGDARDQAIAVVGENVEQAKVYAEEAGAQAEAAKATVEVGLANTRVAVEASVVATDKADLALKQAGVATAQSQVAQGYASGDNDYSAKHYAQMAQAAFERAGLYFNGPYSSDTVYGPNDFVSVETDGKYDFYISLTEGNTADLTDTKNWRLFFTIDGGAGGGGSGTLRQTVISGTPMTVIPAAEIVVSNIVNAKASNTSNVSAPYETNAGYKEWPSTVKINAVMGVAWTGQRNQSEIIQKIRIRQSQTAGYRITSVKVQIAPDTTPIWNVKESDWVDLGTYGLTDEFVFDELVLPAYTKPSNFYAIRILANANGPADETVKYWAVSNIEMIKDAPQRLTVGPLIGTIANGFDAEGKPQDIPVKLAAAVEVPLPSGGANKSVYIDANGTVSIAGLQKGGTKVPELGLGAVFFKQEAQKNYVKTSDGFEEFPKLAVGEFVIDESGTITEYKVYPMNAHFWADCSQKLDKSGGEMSGDFGVDGNIEVKGGGGYFGNRIYLRGQTGHSPWYIAARDYGELTFQNAENNTSFNILSNGIADSSTKGNLLGALDKSIPGGIGSLNGEAKQPMSEVQGGLVEALSATGGTIVLGLNKTYKATLESSTTFTLPAPVAGQENFILVYAKLTAAVGINWGDVLFYNSAPEAPLAVGAYEFVFSYDENAAKWTVGVLPKGAE